MEIFCPYGPFQDFFPYMIPSFLHDCLVPLLASTMALRYQVAR